MLWRTSVCANKSLIVALGAAKGNSKHREKSMWKCSLLNSLLMVLLMVLCCLPFVTKGRPPPTKTLTGFAWLAAAECGHCTEATWTESSYLLHLYFGIIELDHIRVVAVFCFVPKVISDGLFIRGREGCSWNSLTSNHTTSHTHTHIPLVDGKRQGSVRASP